MSKPVPDKQIIDKAMEFFNEHGFVMVKSGITGAVYKVGSEGWMFRDHDGISRDRMEKIFKNMKCELLDGDAKETSMGRLFVGSIINLFVESEV